MCCASLLQPLRAQCCSVSVRALQSHSHTNNTMSLMSLQLFLLALGLLVRGSSGEISLTQTPKAAAVDKGASVTLRCHSDMALDDDLHWYLQKDTEPPKLLIYAATSRHSGVSSRFSGTFGRVEPSLWVLPPSREELAQGKATLVCLANKGFPSDWSVSWKVSGGGAGGEQSRSPAVPQKDGHYSWSSSLTLPAQQWREGGVAVSCEASQGSQSPVSHTLSTLQCSQD